MQINYGTNPLNPYSGCKKYTLKGTHSPNSIVDTLFTRLSRPTILFVNGEVWGRARWNTVLHDDSNILFVELPQGATAYVVVTLILAVGSFIYSLSTSKPTGDTAAAAAINRKQTYGFSDGANNMNVGSPFVEHFGRCRCYPDLVQQPFVRNELRGDDEENYQYLYLLGIIGVGEYEIENVFIDNTPLTEYDNSEYYIFGPGEQISESDGESGWGLDTAYYEYESVYIGDEEDAPNGFAFSADGTKMYVVGYTNKKVYQYTLSTAWDISTASYDSIYFDVSGQDSSPHGIAFNSAGTKMYILGNANQYVYQYTLSSAWNVGTASYDTVSFGVSSQETSPNDIQFKSDGAKMYIIGLNSDSVHQYTLSTPWDLSTASYDSKSFDASDEEPNPTCFYFSSDGTKLYVTGFNTDNVYQYTLATAWDISTASYDSINFDVSGQDTQRYGMAFNSTGTKMYILGDTGDIVYQYAMGSAGSDVFESIVWTCNELEPQDIGYDDYITCIISAPKTEIEYIEYDIVFRSGLYYTLSDNIYSAAAKWIIEARLVDDSGEPDSAWTEVDTRIQWGASVDPIRLTFKVPVPLGPGRYQVRFKRLTTGLSEPLQSYIDGPTAQTAPTLSGLRGYGPPHPDYGDVTLIFARIKATDQLNGNVSSQVNVVATRKLGTVSSGGIGSTLTATRSIIDAIGYIVTASNCGNQSDSLVDWDALSSLRSTFAAAGYYFDHRFTSRVSVMDAAAAAAACGRAVPYMPGGLFSVVQDVDQEVPTCVFTADNTTNLTITTNPKTADTPTCVNISYTDPDTWDEKTISCFDAYGSDDNPTEITLQGCTTRQQAYEIGMFLYLQGRLERTFVSFVTNSMGYIPPLLSKVLVPNKMTNWGASGLVLAVEGMTIWLSEPVDFDGWAYGLLYVTLEDGTAGGPYTVEPTEYAHAVTGTISVLNTLDDVGLKATRFLFGVDADEKLLVRVSNITPQGRDSIKISGTIVAHEIYEDQGTAPADDDVTWNQGLLDAINLIYLGEDSTEHEFYLVWMGSAESVLIELDEGDSSGFVTLEDGYTSYGYLFTTDADVITVRVTPYDESDLDEERAIEVEWDYSDYTGESS